MSPPVPGATPPRWRSLESTFCGWILRARRRSARDNTRQSLSLSLSLVKEEEGREEDGWKEGRRREREGIWGARNVKLSWLNTGQIYRTIDAFGPLQPAVVDISLRHWSTKRRAATIAPRGMRYHLRITNIPRRRVRIVPSERKTEVRSAV